METGADVMVGMQVNRAMAFKLSDMINVATASCQCSQRVDGLIMPIIRLGHLGPMQIKHLHVLLQALHEKIPSAPLHLSGIRCDPKGGQLMLAHDEMRTWYPFIVITRRRLAMTNLKGWDDTPWQRSLPIGSVVVPPQETHIHPLEASVEWRPDILEAFVLNAEGIPVIKI